MSITKSSGSVFEDIGFRPAEATVLEMRSTLMLSIMKEIAKRRMSQTEAAKLFGVTQPRISDLKRGKMALFTVESLIEMLVNAGISVSMTVESFAAVATGYGEYMEEPPVVHNGRTSKPVVPPVESYSRAGRARSVSRESMSISSTGKENYHSEGAGYYAEEEIHT
ncbi:MAG: helix-turn-helix transcriptional regulator [Candidatus Kapaibacterium sp.]